MEKEISTLDSLIERLSHLNDYFSYRCDIVANDPHKWMGSHKYYLPSFEYYLKNCVEDKGEKYDFTLRSYSTPGQILQPITFHNQNKYQMNSKRLSRKIIHSFWMGTPFNYETIIKTK